MKLSKVFKEGVSFSKAGKSYNDLPKRENTINLAWKNTGKILDKYIKEDKKTSK